MLVFYPRSKLVSRWRQEQKMDEGTVSETLDQLFLKPSRLVFLLERNTFRLHPIWVAVPSLYLSVQVNPPGSWTRLTTEVLLLPGCSHRGKHVRWMRL